MCVSFFEETAELFPQSGDVIYPPNSNAGLRAPADTGRTRGGVDLLIVGIPVSWRWCLMRFHSALPR